MKENDLLGWQYALYFSVINFHEFFEVFSNIDWVIKSYVQYFMMLYILLHLPFSYCAYALRNILDYS